MFKYTGQTQRRRINISILLWQRVSVLLGHLQAIIDRYGVQSAYIVQYGVPYYLEGVNDIH